MSDVIMDMAGGTGPVCVCVCVEGGGDSHIDMICDYVTTF